MQYKLKSPVFESHLTLAGPYLYIEKPFFNELKTFAESHSAIMLQPDGYNFKQEMFKSFYISIKNSRHLKELRKKLYDLKEFDLEDNYSPHISLSYGNHEIKEKKFLVSKLTEFKKPIKMAKIGLVEVDEDINLWKILESFDLN